MKPIKIAIIWHFHQPYYRKDNEFILPWVRLHGVKDYFNLPELFHEYPNIKQTINLVPSLRMQIEEYISGKCEDKIQRLTRIPSSQLTNDNKHEILRLFYLCNHENMINPYNRYKELLERSKDNEIAINEFSNQDWLDLQVWYNLTWLGGYSREHKAAKRLFQKERNFTEEEKIALLEMHKYILSQIRPQTQMLQTLGQIEISCTPVYHPILPLISDTHSAKEAMPDILLPEKRYLYPQDAQWHIKSALDYFESTSGKRPLGMWPSEGSISNEVLNIMIGEGLKWTASDEEVLKNSTGEKYENIDKYFPRKYQSDKGSIAMLFRDHSLSDAIGFVYARWNAYDAAIDFTNKIKHIRSEIVNRYGEDALDHAVVPVILDGENCWEFYRNNGVDFQRSLYDILSNDGTFQTITPSEAVKAEHTEFLPPIKRIRAGSWINANFRIWIGNRQNREAWTMLAKAREAIEIAKDEIDESTYNKALGEIYIAEGSDWFWWYCDDHQAENKYDFDMLFRWRLEQVYKIIGTKPPLELLQPIHEPAGKANIQKQNAFIHPKLDGLMYSQSDWENAGYYDAEKSMGAMHHTTAILKKVFYGSNDSQIFFRLELTRELKEDEKIRIELYEPNRCDIMINKYSSYINFLSDHPPFSIGIIFNEVIDIEIDKKYMQKLGSTTYFCILLFRILSSSADIYYPRQDKLCFEFI